MHQLWIHTDFILNRRGYRYRNEAASFDQTVVFNEEEPVREGRSPAGIMAIMSGVLLFLTALPLLLLKLGVTPNRDIVVAALPKLMGARWSANDRALYGKLTATQQRDFTAQVYHIAQIIDGTRAAGGVNSYDLALLIVKESERARYDAHLVASVIMAESAFHKHARSPKGAIGLMQIMPATGRYVSQLSQERWAGTALLRQPEYNVRLGIAYLKHLAKLFDNDLQLVLMAYNWGPTNLQKYLSNRRRSVPRETQDYWKKIMRYHKNWSQDFKRQLPHFKFT